MNILFYIIIVILMIAILLLFLYHDTYQERRIKKLEKQKDKTLKLKQKKLNDSKTTGRNK